jgi:KDO2-lipid IV(A) lauroyltransferase
MVMATRPLQACSSVAAQRFGTRLGTLGYHLAVRQRKRSCANLHLAYGDTLDAPARAALTRRVFQHFGRGIVDFLRAPTLTEETLRRQVTCEGWEYVEAARASGKGVLFCTGHIGNWEILGRWLANAQHLPLTVVAKDPKNPAFARYIRAMREGAGFAVLSKGESARTLLKTLKRGEAICLLADQSSADVFTPFFGIPTGTVAGPATLALHAGVALVPIFCVQKPEGDFLIRCLPALSVPESKDHSERVHGLTSAMNRAFETVIREYPEQWLWLHNRWKASFDERYIARAWQCDGQTPSQTEPFLIAKKRWSGER